MKEPKPQTNYRSHLSFLIIILVGLTLQTSCSDRKDIKRGEIILLSGESMKIDSDLFGQTFVVLIDSTLYMSSREQDVLYNVLQIKEDGSLAKVRRLIPRGKGPYEGNIMTTSYDLDSKKLYFFEISMGFRSGYVIDTNTDIYNTSLWEKLDLSKIQNHRTGIGNVSINDSLLLIVAGVYESPNILTIINLNTQEIIPLQFWVDDGYNMNDRIKQGVYINNANVFHNKSLDRYLYVCGWGRYIELFSLDNYAVTQRKIVENIFPEYESRNDGLRDYQIKDDFKYRRLSTWVTDRYIYIKQNEYTMNGNITLSDDYKGYSTSYHDIIDVYDWDGSYIKSYQTDIPFYNLLVSPNDDFIIVVTNDLETDRIILKRYQLKE